jgi:hypothetical protein
MGPYLSTSFSQRAAPGKKKRSKLLNRLVPIICGTLGQRPRKLSAQTL